MKKITLPPTKVLLLYFLVIFQLGCSKDSDLLYDYVAADGTSVSKYQNNDAQQNTATDSTTTAQQEDISEVSEDGAKQDMGELKAFPGAEGFGKNATGGRGGIMVEVTNLNDSGPGSLREALKMRVTRTIVFRVGGTINCSDYLEIPNGAGNVTIAGQTAPGDGILIKGGELRISASNVILRYLRFRQDSGSAVGSNLDGIKIKSFQSNPIKDIIIDHCSVSWGVDENISITNSENVTIQNSIFSECSKNFLIQNSKNVSVLNNLMALNNGRNIRANTIPHLDLTFELINNIIYGFNWGTGASEGLRYTILENQFISSKSFSSVADYAVDMPAVNPDNGELNRIENTYAFIKNNISDNGLSGIIHPMINPYLQNAALYSSGYFASNAANLESKIIANVGASLPSRDAVDQRIVNNYLNSDGVPSNSGSFPTLNNGVPYLDDDHDGMEDGWELVNNLDAKDHLDGKSDKNSDGFTNLEEFLYYLTL